MFQFSLNLIFLVPLVCGVFCLPIGAGIGGLFYILNFGAKYERKGFWFSKTVILLGFLISVLSIMLVPLDIAVNNIFNDYFATFLVSIGVQFFYLIVAFFIVVIVPFFICFYESQNPDRHIIFQFLSGCCWTAIVIVVVFITFVVTYIFALAVPFLAPMAVEYLNGFVNLGQFWGEVGYNIIQIPDGSYETFYQIDSYNSTIVTVLKEKAQIYEFKAIPFVLSPVVWLVVLFNFIGWILFSAFGGCGLTALPVYCLTSCFRKPKRIKMEEYAKRKQDVTERAKTLMEVGEKLEKLRKRHKLGRKDFLTFRNFKEATTQLEEDWDILETSFKGAGGNIFKPICDTCCGLIFAFISIIWIFQIILSRGFRIFDDIVQELVPQILGFFGIPFKLPLRLAFPILASIMKFVDSLITGGFPLIGSILFLGLSLYILICVYMGNITISSRIPLLNVHPLKPQDTMIHTLLFNQGMVLLCLLPLNQFVIDIFGTYTRGTSLYSLFDDVIMNIKIIGLFFRYIHYLFLLFSIIGFFGSCCLFIFPRRSVSEKKLAEVLKRLEDRKGNIITNTLYSIKTSCLSCIPNFSLPDWIPIKLPF